MFGVNANAQTIEDTTDVSSIKTAQTIKNEGGEKVIWNNLKDKSSWKGIVKYGHGNKTAGGFLGTLWMIGWLFSIGYLGLTFWKGVLALIVWPYYLGKRFSKHD